MFLSITYKLIFENFFGMFQDVLFLYLDACFAAISEKMVVVEYRYEIERQKCRSRKSPDYRPSKSAPHRIRSYDETSKNRCDTRKHYRHESFLGSFDDAIGESFSFFYKLVDVIKKYYRVSDDYSTESYGSYHRGRREIFSFY